MPSIEMEASTETCDRKNAKPILGLSALLLISIAGLMLPLPGGGRILPKLGDMAHAPLFAGITIGLVLFWHSLRPLLRWRPLLGRLLLASITVFVFGALTEIAQSLTGRTGSLHDLAADSWGIFAAVCLLVARGTKSSAPPKKWSMLLLVIAVGSIAFSWIVPVHSILDAVAMKREFPLLGSFERNAELERWHFANCDARRVHRNEFDSDAVTDGDWALEVSYQPGSHTSATLYELQKDWAQSDGIKIDAFASKQAPPAKHAPLASGKVEVAVQIIDAHHDDEFQDICRKVFVVELGKPSSLKFPKEQWNTLRGRPLDRKAIRYLDLQLASRPANVTVRYDNIRLYSIKELATNQPMARVAR
jgi:hypothetical protein